MQHNKHVLKESYIEYHWVCLMNNTVSMQNVAFLTLQLFAFSSQEKDNLLKKYNIAAFHTMKVHDSHCQAPKNKVLDTPLIFAQI